MPNRRVGAGTGGAEGRRREDVRPRRAPPYKRHVVISIWDWSTPKIYLHDAIASDKRNPRLNANGLIYGSPEEAADVVPVLDPVKNTTTLIKHPYLDPKTPSTGENTMGPSLLGRRSDLGQPHLDP